MLIYNCLEVFLDALRRAEGQEGSGGAVFLLYNNDNDIYCMLYIYIYIYMDDY